MQLLANLDTFLQSMYSVSLLNVLSFVVIEQYYILLVCVKMSKLNNTSMLGVTYNVLLSLSKRQKPGSHINGKCGEHRLKTLHVLLLKRQK